MRGSPLRQLLGVSLVVVLLGVAVWSLTRPSQPAPAAAPAPAPVSEMVAVELVLTTTGPATVEFSPWSEGPARQEITDRLSQTARLPAGQRTEMTFRVQWPDQTRPQALRAEIRWDGETIADRTFWGTGSAEDVLAFQVPQP